MKPPKMSMIRHITAAKPAPTISICISINKGSYLTMVPIFWQLDKTCWNTLRAHWSWQSYTITDSPLSHQQTKDALPRQNASGERKSTEMTYTSILMYQGWWSHGKLLRPYTVGVLPEHCRASFPSVTTTITTFHTDMNINAVPPTNTIAIQWDIAQMLPTIFAGQIRTTQGENSMYH